MITSIIIVKVHGNFHVPFLIIFAKVNRNFLVPLHVIFVKGTWKFPYSFPFYFFLIFRRRFFSTNVPNILVIKCVEHNLRKSKVTRKKKLRISYRATQRRFPPKCIESTFWAIQSTFRSLEIHSKRRYKIFICSAILESFRNYQSFTDYFPENFTAIHRFYESEIFLIPPLPIAFWIPKIVGFPFSAKNSVIWGMKCEKLNFRKS